jgi:hypothetical protein
MRGQDGIINMRKKGLVPSLINIDDFDFKSPLTNWEEQDDVPTVCVHQDVLEMLDLRFLIGMTVNITSCSEERAKKLFHLCKKAKAKNVIAGHTVRVGEVCKTGWMDFYHG